MRHPDQPELGALVDRFERRVFAQKPVAAEHYDQDYFASDWREDENKYDLETRRRIEAQNPQLIKDVLEPTRVLDIGCGPGFLMELLRELDVEVHGIDYAEASIDLAPEGVKDKITIGSVTDPHVEPRSFDVVVCREVMEHMTVLQVRETVRRICQASSRYAYVTTRFHPEPSDLLDFTTQFDVDPSHITLLTKDFLRLLFVLEGFRRRPDLEDQMDWGDKNRALVYERVPEPEPGPPAAV
ncbi:MAG TPA: methyltransferase domain-containing protein [Solirubrobacteraceae bacterium]|nr:methyltransferase domain-containing protein [Solirubrobacteraceae bacterium]